MFLQLLSFRLILIIYPLIHLSVLLALSLICHHSRSRSAPMFYVKTFTFLAMTATLSPLFIVTGLRRIGDPGNIDLMAPYLRAVFTFLFGLQVRISGSTKSRARLFSADPLVVVANHQSGIDFILMSHLWPPNCTCLAKKSLLYTTGPFGLLCWLSGIQFVSRGNSKDVKERMIALRKMVVDRKTKVWVFAEGSRNTGPRLMPFKLGAFKLAADTGVPVIPLVISNLARVYSYAEKYWIPGQVDVHLLDPQWPTQNPEIFARETRNKMMDVLTNTTQIVDFRQKQQ